MAKRMRKAPTERVSYRWPKGTCLQIERLSESTGMSEAKASMALVELGILAYHGNAGEVAAERKRLDALAEVHAAKLKGAELVAAARKRLAPVLRPGKPADQTHPL